MVVPADLNGLPFPRLLPVGPRPLIRVQLSAKDKLANTVGKPFYRGRLNPFTLYRTRPGKLLLRWDYVGDFLIERQGRSITARPLPGVPFGRLRDLLLTAIASFALLQRGVETLHASSVTWNHRALAFLGGPGSGKSTLAAFFARRGCRLLSDDLLAIQSRGRQLLAYASMPEIKLAPAAARALGLAPARLPRVEPGNSKRIWAVEGAPGPLPLAALYFLRVASRRGGVRLVLLTHRATFRALLSCSYNVTRPTRSRLRRQFALFAHMAHLRARRLLIPRGFARLEEVAERIEQDLGERSG